MSCDHKSTNERMHCIEKNSSYIINMWLVVGGYLPIGKLARFMWPTLANSYFSTYLKQ